MTDVTRIGVLTGGGDAPGLNAVIRAVVKAACNAGIACVGLEDSFDALIEADRSRLLTPREVTGIMRLGGTILGTTNRGNPFAYPVNTPEGVKDYSDLVVDMVRNMSNRGNPFAYPVNTPEGVKDYSDLVVDMVRNMRLDALVVIGGDGTLGIAHKF